MQLLDTPPLLAFATQLEGNGRGTATFAPWPGFPSSGGFKGSLAAASDKVDAVVVGGATQAVTLSIQP